jgi:predicted DNA-binding protein (MmcQ/YjbR family)
MTLQRLQEMATALPEAERVDVEAWGDQPTFRVRGKTFVFSNGDATSISIKLDPDEAAALVATRPDATPTSYGLGRHGWVTVTLRPEPTDAEWDEVAEWVETSYRLVAPKRLVRQLDSR